MTLILWFAQATQNPVSAADPLAAGHWHLYQRVQGYREHQGDLQDTASVKDIC